jgi:hypothetical protein
MFAIKSRVALTLTSGVITVGIIVESSNCLKINGKWRRKERDFTWFLVYMAFYCWIVKKIEMSRLIYLD